MALDNFVKNFNKLVKRMKNFISILKVKREIWDRICFEFIPFIKELHTSLKKINLGRDISEVDDIKKVLANVKSSLDEYAFRVKYLKNSISNDIFEINKAIVKINPYSDVEIDIIFKNKQKMLGEIYNEIEDLENEIHTTIQTVNKLFEDLDKVYNLKKIFNAIKKNLSILKRNIDELQKLDKKTDEIRKILIREFMPKIQTLEMAFYLLDGLYEIFSTFRDDKKFLHSKMHFLLDDTEFILKQLPIWFKKVREDLLNIQERIKDIKFDVNFYQFQDYSRVPSFYNLRYVRKNFEVLENLIFKLNDKIKSLNDKLGYYGDFIKDLNLLAKIEWNKKIKEKRDFKSFALRESFDFVVLNGDIYRKIECLEEKFSYITGFYKKFLILSNYVIRAIRMFNGFKKIIELNYDFEDLFQDINRLRNSYDFVEVSPSGILKFGISNLPSVDNIHLYAEVNTVTVLKQVSSNLFTLSPSGKKIVPGLALWAEIGKSANKLIFKLRPNLKWHNGKDIKLEEIRESYMHFKEKGDLPLLEGLIDIKTYPEKNEIEFDFEGPGFNYFLKMALPNANVFLKDKFCGPFYLKEKTDEKFVLEANFYYHYGPPFLKRIEFIKISEAEKELEKGKIDIGSISYSNVSKFEKKENFEILSVERASLNFLNLIQRKDFLKKREVREAITYLLNWDLIKSGEERGVRKAARGLFLPIFEELFSDVFYRYRVSDFKKAWRILKHHIKNIREVSWVRSDTRFNREFYNYLKINLEKMGIKVKEIVSEKVLKYLRERKVDIGISGWLPDTPDAVDFLFPLFHSSGIKKGTNKTMYSDYYADFLMEIAKDISEPYQRKRIAKLIEKKVLLEDFAVIPLYFAKQFYAYKNNIKNLLIPPLTHSLELFYVYKI